MRSGKRKWLALSVLGLGPVVLFVLFFAQEGFDVGEMADQLFGEPLAAANMLVGLSFALPLFFYFRERGAGQAT